ncbi:unnamed protein product [Allacma fusca]|uniref:Carboxylesterase type B domain-containing protein n=1 Tax=Allacma fusca TaxID=39272 RepID=A0A8J2NX90_9HEXA|nr:unnamed protein product [Allacma fusca]
MFGESAGGGSVTFHLLSPISRHLITRGIIQSGTLNAPWSVMEAQEAEDMAKELFIFTGCNNTESDYESVKCLRELPAKTISEEQWNSYKSILAFPSRPTIDGVFLPQHPMDMLKAGDFKRTQLLIGSNKNEGTYFLLYDFLSTFNKDNPVCLSRDKFLEIITQIFPDRSRLEKEAILFQYTNWEDLTDTCKNTELVGDLVGDYFFICPSNAFAQAYAAHGNPVYYYYFTHRSSTNPWGKWMGVMHGDEVEYVFGHPLNSTGIHSLAEQNLSRKIMSYFTRFARTGRPDQHAVDNWPLYTKNEPHYFILNADPPARGKGPRSHHCAFWNEFMPLINSVRSKCDKEIWGPPSSAALSHPAKSFHIVTLMFSFVVVNIFYWNIPSYSKFFHTPHHIG